METLAKEQIALSGSVMGFKANKHGDIDALEVENSGQILAIKFPPHTAGAIMQEFTTGESVSLSYQEETPGHDPKGNKKTN